LLVANDIIDPAYHGSRKECGYTRIVLTVHFEIGCQLLNCRAQILDFDVFNETFLHSTFTRHWNFVFFQYTDIQENETDYTRLFVGFCGPQNEIQ
jgi:hypothetical protein